MRYKIEADNGDGGWVELVRGEGDLAEAVRRTYEELEGHFTFVVIHHDEGPSGLVGGTATAVAQNVRAVERHRFHGCSQV